MGDLISIEDFHQFVLFKIINCDIHSWASHVAVDEDGRVALYENEPRIHNDNEWYPDRAASDKSRFCFQGVQPSLTIVITKIPNHLSWRDCKWKL